MVNFKTYFHEVVLESPDHSTKSGLSWTDTDAVAFAIADGCILLARDNRIFHYQMFIDVQEYDKPKVTRVFGELPHEIQFGRVNSRETFIIDFPEGLIGRIWLHSGEISFWNSYKAFNKRNIGLLNDMFNYYKVNPNEFSFDINMQGYDWELMSWGEVKALVYGKGDDKNTDRIEDWQKQLHTMSPELKSVAMKEMGIKPKQGIPLADKLKMVQGD